jgi:hypothetical protein
MIDITDYEAQFMRRSARIGWVGLALFLGMFVLLVAIHGG